MRKRWLFGVGTVAVAVSLGLAGCATQGSSETPTSSETAAADFNSADVVFAQMMIPHHEQAVEMSDMILAKADVDGRVRDLATQIKAAQQPEIDQLQGWLTEWGASESADDGHGGHDQSGMMSSEDLAALEAATGAEAARLFLEQMVIHHEGALDMAETEVSEGVNSAAIEMAGNTVTTQTAEVQEMQDLLTSL
jgi:uncharacterized protein (DUF305 family)